MTNKPIWIKRFALVATAAIALLTLPSCIHHRGHLHGPRLFPSLSHHGGHHHSSYSRSHSKTHRRSPRRRSRR